MHARSLQLCLILCNPVDCSPPDSCLWDSSGKNTGEGAIFPTQGMELESLMSPALAEGFFTTVQYGKSHNKKKKGKYLNLHMHVCAHIHTV